MTASTSSASPNPRLPVFTERPLRFVAMGASDVVGMGASDPTQDGWVPLVAKALPGRVALMRLGISGALAATLRAQVLPKALQAMPDLVVLFTGVNDCAFQVPLGEFVADLDAILSGLATTGAQVCVLNLPDIDRLPALRPYAGALAAAVPQWQAAVAAAASRHGAHVIDLKSYTAELDKHRDYLAADGYHPSSLGYRRIADVVLQALGVTP